MRPLAHPRHVDADGPAKNGGEQPTILATSSAPDKSWSQSMDNEGGTPRPGAATMSMLDTTPNARYMCTLQFEFYLA